MRLSARLEDNKVVFAQGGADIIQARECDSAEIAARTVGIVGKGIAVLDNAGLAICVLRIGGEPAAFQLSENDFRKDYFVFADAKVSNRINLSVSWCVENKAVAARTTCKGVAAVAADKGVVACAAAQPIVISIAEDDIVGVVARAVLVARRD